MSDSPKPDPYPSLRVDDWESTRELMHMWTQVVGKIRMAREPMVNHWWQVTSYVSARGLTTGVIHDRGSVFELEFDLVDEWIRWFGDSVPGEGGGWMFGAACGVTCATAAS